MRILYLSHYFPPEIGAAASRAHSMSRWLARFGHDVTVLTGTPGYQMKRTPEPYRGRKWMRETQDGVTVYRAWRYTPSAQSNWRRMTNYLSFMTTSWWYGGKLPVEYDAIIVSSPPLFIGLTGTALARQFKAPLIFEVRDLWPETAVDIGVFRPGSFMERSWSAVADFIYKRSAAVVAVTRDIQARLQARGLPESKVWFVPNGVDLETVRLDAADRRKELGLEGKFVALFAGLIGVMQNVSSIVDAAALLTQHRNIHFLIVGDGALRGEVARRIAELGLDNVSLLPPQPREAMPSFLNTADVCFATLAKDVRGAIPYKLLEAWAYEKPIIAAVGDEGEKLVRECNGGLATPADDPKALAKAVLKLAGDEEARRRYGLSGRQCIETRLNREMLARKMENALTTTVKQERKRA